MTKAYRYDGTKPLFHLCEPALDSMGIYNHRRIAKMHEHGWRYWKYMHADGGYAFKYVENGCEIRLLNHRPLMKTALYIPFLVIDMFGREQGVQYYAWSELDQYKGTEE